MYVSKARLNSRHVNAHGQHSPVTNHVCVVLIACVASISNRVIVRKLEREPKKKMEGGGEKRKSLPADPTILENAT